LKEKENQISALFSTQRPPKDWPDALDHLAIGLVADKYTKLGKTCENVLLLVMGCPIKKSHCATHLATINLFVNAPFLLWVIFMEMKQK
jgi:hypothetical protein